MTTGREPSECKNVFLGHSVSRNTGSQGQPVDKNEGGSEQDEHWPLVNVMVVNELGKY